LEDFDVVAALLLKKEKYKAKVRDVFWSSHKVPKRPSDVHSRPIPVQIFHLRGEDRLRRSSIVGGGVDDAFLGDL
jgi:hypothetical protein